MRSSFLSRFFSVFALAVLVTGSAYAQGKGGGKGGGGKHDGGHPGHQKQERRGGRDVEAQPKHEQREKRHEQREKRHEQRQMVDQRHIRQEQRQMGGWEQQRQIQHAQREQSKQWQQSQRQQREVVREQVQQQRQYQKAERHQQRTWQSSQQHDRRVYVQPQRRVENDRENWGQIRRQQNFEAKRYRDDFKEQRKRERQAFKYERKQQKFDDKAYRRADRDDIRRVRSIPDRRSGVWLDNDRGYHAPSYRSEPTYRSYQTYPSYRSYDTHPQYRTNPSYPSYQADNFDYDQYPVDGSSLYGYNDNSYADNYYDNGGFDWKQILLRSVMATFFTNSDNVGYYDSYPRYYASNDDDYGYVPQYASYPYNTFGYEPAYSYYEPAAYYGYDQYAGNGLPYEYSAYSALPYDDMVDLYSGGVGGEMIQRALATGYYQGLLEGQAARSRGWGDNYYQDPYLYEQTMYDPYSSSIGNCRRYFSEGYEMGYTDALGGRDEFDLADSGGDIDLVSLLLGSVLDLRG